LKIKIDEDLPKGLADAVRDVVPDTLTVSEEGLSGILDTALWETVLLHRGPFTIWPPCQTV
jgi:hypothetical protein